MARRLMIVLTLAAAACDNPASPTDDLEDARRTWRRQGVQNYSFTVHQDCFCPEDVRGPFRVRVASSVIVSVTDPATGAPRGASAFVPLTVEMLFDRVQQAIDDGIDELDVRYDPTLGYPLVIEINLSQQAVDAGIVIRASDLEVN
jgi:hypothetical protein